MDNNNNSINTKYKVEMFHLTSRWTQVLLVRILVMGQIIFQVILRITPRVHQGTNLFRNDSSNRKKEFFGWESVIKILMIERESEG